MSVQPGQLQGSLPLGDQNQKALRFFPQIRGLDPRTRVVVAVTFALTVAFMHSPVILTFAFGVSFCCAAMARLPLLQTLRRIFVVESFIVVLILTLPFTMEGRALLTVFGLPLSQEGFYRAIEVGLKANAILFMLVAMVGSMEPPTLGHALYCLRLPPKLVQIFFFTVRYIDVLYREYEGLRTAMKCRGFRAGTNLHTLRSLGYLVGMMLVRSLERSERIMEAMKCRGFNGHFHMMAEFERSAKDRYFEATLAVVTLALLGGDLLL